MRVKKEIIIMKDSLELFEVVSNENYSEDGFNSKIMTEGEIYELSEEILEDFDSRPFQRGKRVCKKYFKKFCKIIKFSKK